MIDSRILKRRWLQIAVKGYVLVCLIAVVICLPVIAGSLQWQLIDPGTPLGDEISSMVHLTAQGETWLRIEDQYMVPQAWLLQADTWVRDLETSYPAPMFRAVWAYDSDRQVVVRFGGVDKDLNVSSETWEFDGNAWIERTDIGAPPARLRASMAYDTVRNVIVLFGGYGADDLARNDVWEYDGAMWAEVQPSLPLPIPRYDASMAYDETRQRMVMAFGRGVDTPDLFDTWEYDGSQWIKSPFQPPSSPRSNASMAYDRVRQKVYVFGGESTAETAYWDGEEWQVVETNTSPTARRGAGMTFDDARGEILMQGGALGASYRYDFWKFNGTDWVEITVSHPAVKRRISSLSYDPVYDRSLAYGGSFCCNIVNLEDTLVFDGVNWSAPLPVFFPGRLNGHTQKHIPEIGHHIVYGGMKDNIEQDSTYAYDFDLDEWEELSPANRPSARTGHNMVYSSGHGGLVLFGGQDPWGKRNDTWLYQGGDWSELVTQGAPDKRTKCAMTYDQERAIVLLYGGNLADSLADKTWQLDGDVWTELTVSGPGIRKSASMVYDPIRERSVLFGGAHRSDGTEDTWEFDGLQWTSVSTTYSPDMRRTSGSATWDSRRKVILFAFGESRTSGGVYNDLWAYGWDEDDDLAVGGYDNCPETANADQENLDGDPAGDACDCAGSDSGSFAVPGEVLGMVLSGGASTSLSWNDQSPQSGADVLYDLVSGSISDLHMGGFSASICLMPGLTAPSHSDARLPVLGSGYYYLVRGRNVCAAGTYGPVRIDLDQNSPCP
ncbi:MAG: hypothetical protein IFK94_14555 [Acidobacteria bacterium]|uniref:Kelch motif protein n=1 Tax=Candidatus Polarisedimenticola svalbardensis TaxID=2886004 RepID=A0A8J6Y6S7_9BACT|nr:hypothetical protein [Candidatus Polarisedimenticola svalbardensis]